MQSLHSRGWCLGGLTQNLPVQIMHVHAAELRGEHVQEATLKPALEEQRRIQAKHGNKLDMEVLSEMEVRDRNCRIMHAAQP